jgi:hypothetical protein
MAWATRCHDTREWRFMGLFGDCRRGSKASEFSAFLGIFGDLRRICLRVKLFPKYGAITTSPALDEGTDGSADRLRQTRPRGLKLGQFGVGRNGFLRRRQRDSTRPCRAMQWAMRRWLFAFFREFSRIGSRLQIRQPRFESGRGLSFLPLGKLMQRKHTYQSGRR